jgi:murein DD-endopeptidase MepM/ murein hydrolase activator NlpD
MREVHVREHAGRWERHPVTEQAPLTRREAREREARKSGLAAVRRSNSQTQPNSQGPKTRGVNGAVKESPRRHPAVRTTSKLLSLGAMIFAAVLLVGMSVPANAFFSSASPLPSSAARDLTGLQSVDVAADATAAPAARDSFTVISYAELLRLQYGNRSYSFVATTGAIRWPFPYAVPISDGWGARVAPCLGCSTFHQGVDFTPGAGSPIYAIAAGIVTEHKDDNYGFGNHVILSHQGIPGPHVDSLYAHMITGSSPLKVGDTVKVGDFIGLVGETGSAAGAHLHFEIHLDGVPVDPFAWLTANTAD